MSRVLGPLARTLSIFSRLTGGWRVLVAGARYRLRVRATCAKVIDPCGIGLLRGEPSLAAPLPNGFRAVRHAELVKERAGVRFHCAFRETKAMVISLFEQPER